MTFVRNEKAGLITPQHVANVLTELDKKNYHYPTLNEVAKRLGCRRIWEGYEPVYSNETGT